MYAKSYIVRFEGTLTQGPNKDKSYTYANSWGGSMFQTEEAAKACLAKYRRLEPTLTYKLLSRQYNNNEIVETEIS